MHLLYSVNWALIFGPLIYFIIVGGLLDGWFVYRWLRPRRFAFAFGQALLANLVSLVIGFLAWPYIFPNGFDYAELSMISYGMLWLVTMLAEVVILIPFYRKQPRWKLFAASASMNLVSFVLVYLFFWWMN